MRRYVEFVKWYETDGIELGLTPDEVLATLIPLELGEINLEPLSTIFGSGSPLYPSSRLSYGELTVPGRSQPFYVWVLENVPGRGGLTLTRLRLKHPLSYSRQDIGAAADFWRNALANEEEGL